MSSDSIRLLAERLKAEYLRELARLPRVHGGDYVLVDDVERVRQKHAARLNRIFDTLVTRLRDEFGEDVARAAISEFEPLRALLNKSTLDTIRPTLNGISCSASPP